MYVNCCAKLLPCNQEENLKNVRSWYVWYQHLWVSRQFGIFWSADSSQEFWYQHLWVSRQFGIFWSADSSQEFSKFYIMTPVIFQHSRLGKVVFNYIHLHYANMGFFILSRNMLSFQKWSNATLFHNIHVLLIDWMWNYNPVRNRSQLYHW